MKITLRYVLCWMVLSVPIMAAVNASPGDVQPLNAFEAILSAFDRHPIVALSEMHGMREEHDFIRALLRHEAFPGKVDAVVMEGANSLHQDILDKYILDCNTPVADVRVVWRNSSQSPNTIWDAAVFERIYTTIREVNETLPRSERIRVIAGGVPIDWAEIESADDWRGQMKDRSAYYASVVQNEVLEKEKKALLIIGGMHLIKASTSANTRGTVTQHLEAHRPGSVFVVWPHAGLLGADMDLQYLPEDDSSVQRRSDVTTKALEERMASWSIPSIAIVEGTWLGELRLSHLLPGGFSFDGEYIPSERRYGGLSLSDGIDAYLYVGPKDSLTLSAVTPAAYEDEAYLEELNRRSLIRFGRPFDPDMFLREPMKYFQNGP